MSKKSIIERHMEVLLFDIKRGFLQFVVLSLIAQGSKYAYEIKHQVYQVTGGAFDIDLNNLYKKLRMLERDKILKSFEKPSVLGANRKYYALTPFGNIFFNKVQTLIRPVIDSFYLTMQKINLETTNKNKIVKNTTIRKGGYIKNKLPDPLGFGKGGKISGPVKKGQIARVCVDALSNSAKSNKTYEAVNAATIKEERHTIIIRV